jgi:phosphate-selective porin
MLRTSVCLAAMLLVLGQLPTASAQSAAPAATAPAATAAPAAAKPSRMKLTVEKLKAMKAKWIANRPKLKACRKEVKAKGLSGDDRWFYIEDCMDKI